MHVIPSVAPRYGGPSSAVSAMCRSLNDSGVETLIATTNGDGPGHLTIATGAPLKFNGADTIFFHRQFSDRFGYSYPLARWLNLNVTNFDVVHIHAVFSHACIASALACRRNGVPYIVRPLGSLDPWSINQKPWRKRLMWQVAVGRMLRDAAAVHYTTLEEKRQAESINRLARGVVIPLGITVNDSAIDDAGKLFKSRYPSLGDHPYILVLSRLHTKKNLEALIEAFLNVSNDEDFAGWRLVIAGDGEKSYTERLKSLAGNTDGGDRVVFTGWLADDLKTSALVDAQLLALPSFQENFGLCVAEALGFGVPVIVSRAVNLAPDVLAAEAGWVTGLGAGELERTLTAAMSDEEERKRRGRAGREFVARRFAWSQVAAELIQFYQSVIRNEVEQVATTQTVQLAGQ
ncbi:MAG TPA: glycosyltransferase [Pyrinomonadaceae bacterium]|nr:glycosyltransferase [Pyrinomonadaceae bacterium]